MRISDWRSDVCSSDLENRHTEHPEGHRGSERPAHLLPRPRCDGERDDAEDEGEAGHQDRAQARARSMDGGFDGRHLLLFLALFREFDDQDRILRRERDENDERSEEHTSELQSLMRISYAVFCLKKKKRTTKQVTRLD